MTRPNKQFLAEFELYLMLAVARLDGEAYGAAILRDIESRTDRQVSLGAVYATLSRLESKKLLRHSASAPLPVKGGRSRKLYELTRAGRSALATSTTMLKRMMEGVTLAGGKST